MNRFDFDTQWLDPNSEFPNLEFERYKMSFNFKMKLFSVMIAPTLNLNSLSYYMALLYTMNRDS